jgi:uncharacterized protein
MRIPHLPPCLVVTSKFVKSLVSFTFVLLGFGYAGTVYSGSDVSMKEYDAAVIQVYSSEPPIKVLIVDGFNNHNWQLSTKLIREILLSAGNIDVDVTTTPPTKAAVGWHTWRPQFSDYDVVLQNTSDIKATDGIGWPREVQLALEKFVSKGGGLLAFHSANNAFADWPEYNNMLGLAWRAADYGSAVVVHERHSNKKDTEVVQKLEYITEGKGGRTGHGKRRDVLVTRFGDHPMHKALPKQWRAADLEVYRYVRGPAKNLTVLSYARDVSTNLFFPTEWTVAYGKGRVYTSTFGHVWHKNTVPDAMRCSAAQTLLQRAVIWLARNEKRLQNITIPVDFPGIEKVSLRVM